MDFMEFKELVIAKCKALGITEYELYYATSEETSVEAFQHELNEFSASLSGGLCLRCIVGGKMGYASTQALNAAEAEAIVERAADNARSLESEDPVFLGEGGQSYTAMDRQLYPLASTEELIGTTLSTLEKLYKANEAVTDGCQIQGFLNHSRIAICNSKGLDLAYENNTAGLVAIAVVSGGEEMSDSFKFKLGQLDQINTDELVQKAAQEALQKLGGEVAPTGQYSVVFDPEAMSSLLQVYAPIFSSDVAQKGLSKLSGKEGEAVASSLVTLVDDPFHKENPEPLPFDAEGSPTYRKNIIENGRLQTLLYNLKTAHKAGKKTTGNASKAGYDATVAISPFTMYLEGGEMTEDQLLKKVGYGVYINSLDGLHAGADPISGDFSLQSAGFMIRDGKKAEYVKSFTVAGNFYDLLHNITALANNVTLPMALGKTAYGAPSTWVEGLSVAGK